MLYSNSTFTLKVSIIFMEILYSPPVEHLLPTGGVVIVSVPWDVAAGIISVLNGQSTIDRK